MDTNTTPEEGMAFTTVDEAFEFYNSYAKLVGFGTRRSSAKRRVDGTIWWQQFVCTKHGQYTENTRKSVESNASEGASSSTAERNRGIVTNADLLRCSCRFFEFQGFPCRHMLHFFSFSHVMRLPEQYILKRWTKNAKVGGIWDNMRVDVSEGSNKSIMHRRAIISEYFTTVFDDAVLSDKGTELAKKKCDELADELKQLNLTHDDFRAPTRRSLPVEVNMSDPKQIRAKGCGRRSKSGKEKAIRKGRQCRACGLRDQSHDKRNCPMLIDRDNINANDDSSDSSEQEERQ